MEEQSYDLFTQMKVILIGLMKNLLVESYRDNHQNGISPLLDYGINCVKGFSLDYMHLVCLGVVKRILWFFQTRSS